MTATRIMAAGALTVMCLGLAACNSTPKVSDKDVQKVDYGQLVQMIEKGGKTPPLIVDVRSPEKFAAGHIPGAINIPFTELTKDNPMLGGAEGRSLIPSFGTSSLNPIVVYSFSWTDALSHGAAKKLMRLGYAKDRIYDFRGGLDFWQKSGGNVTTQ
jgi:3-mercaptopyruvate sulfurtransferase SseA